MTSEVDVAGASAESALRSKTSPAVMAAAKVTAPTPAAASGRRRSRWCAGRLMVVLMVCSLRMVSRTGSHHRVGRGRTCQEPGDVREILPAEPGLHSRDSGRDQAHTAG